MPDYILGIDGGGTSCRAAVAVADVDGRILGRGKSGASNILSDPDNALRHIDEAARLAFRDAGLSESLVSSSSAILGLAGNNVGDAVNYVLARLPFQRAKIVNDGLIALEGAVGSEDGAIAILGTGTICLARRGGELTSIGGWGFQVSDLGSGARLGHAALQECLLAHDNVRPMTPLSAELLAEFGNDPEQVVGFARKASPGDFGRYAPRVFFAAERGDETALRILHAAAGEVDAALDAVALVMRGEGRLCLLGGLAALYPPYLAERHRNRVSESLADALTGAVSLAVAELVAEGSNR